MFVNKVTSTPFTTDASNQFFRNKIYESSLGADASFISTLRALLYQRIGDNTISIQFSSSRFSSDQVNSYSFKNLTRSMLNEDPASARDKIYIHSINGDSPHRVDNMKAIKNRFVKNYTGFNRAQKVTDFFRKSFPVVCYVNPDTRVSILFIDKVTFKKFHAIQSATLAFLPWYFNPDDEITKNELALIEALQEKTPDRYLEVLENIYASIDIRSMQIKSQLKGFEAKHDEERARNLEYDIENINSSLSRYLEDVANKTQQLNDRMMELSTIKNRIAGSTDDIMEYFLRNKTLDFNKVDGNVLYFNVRGQIIYFDEELAKRCIDNSSSFIYEYLSHSPFDFDTYKSLMTAIFIDQTLKINVVGSFKLSCSGSVHAISGQHYNKTTYRDYTPNPHLYHYACLGNNAQAIAQFIKNGNLIGAVEQCCAANSSLNFNDGAVIPKFMRTLCTADLNNRCIQTPTGEVLKPEEAVAWLKKNSAKEETVSE